MLSVPGAYRRLLSRYGPQGWWPVTPPGGRLPRYRPGRRARPSAREALEICAGAILTQNTAWSNVTRALEALHGAGAMDARRLAAMPLKELKRLVRPSGYFAQKSLKLRRFARHLLSRGGRADRWLAGGRTGPLREELLSLYGVGPETADSMLLYAGRRPVFVVDAYTRRIGSRLGWFPEAAGYDAVQAFFQERLPRSVPVYQELHALLVELAKRACRKREPDCPACPLKSGCARGGGR